MFVSPALDHRHRFGRARDSHPAVQDMALQTDSSFFKHRPSRVDAPLLAVVTLILDDISIKISGEGVFNPLADDHLKRLLGSSRRTIKRHVDHLRSLRT